MDGLYRNEGPLVRVQEKYPVALGHPRRPLHDDPMLTAVKMFLEAQAFPGKYLESLDLIPWPCLQDGPRPPGTLMPLANVVVFLLDLFILLRQHLAPSVSLELSVES